MERQAYLGIDVSKGYAEFVLIDKDKNHIESPYILKDTRTDRKRLSGLIESWLGQGLTTLYCGLESTGGYENNWYRHLCGLACHYPQQVKVARINPKAIKHCGLASMQRTTTDGVSAFNIAQYVLCYPERIQFSPREEASPHSDLKHARKALKLIDMMDKQRQQLSNQLEKLIYEWAGELMVYCRNGIPKWLLNTLIHYPGSWHVGKATAERLSDIRGITYKKADSILAKLDTTSPKPPTSIAETIRSTAHQILHLIRSTDSQMARLCEEFADNEVVRLLQTIVGVGQKTAVRVLLEVEDIRRFNTTKQLAAYFGVNPSWKQSGDGLWYKGMSKQGRGELRGALYMSGITAIRHDDSMASLYHRFRSQGMNHYQAMGVIMHKLLRTIYGV